MAASSLMALASSGCLISDPPEHEERTQTVPALDALQAEPPATQILRVEVDQLESTTVPFRSEDDGVRPVAQLFLNYAVSERPILLGFDSQRASTFDDTDRSFSISWLVPRQTGCQQITLLATHTDNLGEDNLPIRVADASQITWWADIQDPSDPTSSLMEDCPSQSDFDTGGGP